MGTKFLHNVARIVLSLLLFGLILSASQALLGRYHSNFNDSKKPKILLWQAPLWYRRKFQRRGNKPIRRNMPTRCGGCVLTTNKQDFEEAKAVVFHDTFIERGGNFPVRSKRSESQLFVFWTLENPYYTKRHLHSSVGLEAFDKDFNLTMTYRSDSDVVVVYGCWKNLKPEPLDYEKKTNLAAFIASDCQRLGAKMRLNFVKSLQKRGLKVDCYGKCFGQRYEGNVSTLLKTYKFFLAFENGIRCREYITEKFWSKALGRGLVPIVWGTSRLDVQRVAPPRSFIHVDDFESVQKLVDYINYLDQNDNAYREYFKWRNLAPSDGDPGIACPNLSPDMPKSDYSIPFGFCELCKLIQSTSDVSRIPSLTDWWYGTESQQCLGSNFAEDQKSTLKNKYDTVM